MQFLSLLYSAGVLWFKTGSEHLSAALAYYVPFALTPLVFISITIVGLVSGTERVVNLLMNWGKIIDPELTTIIFESVVGFETLTDSFRIPLLLVIFFSAMIFVSINMLIWGLNTVWGINPKGIKAIGFQWVRNFLFFIVLQTYILSLVLMQAGAETMVDITTEANLFFLYDIAQFAATVGLCLFGFSILPAEVYTLKARVYGSLLATVLFFAAKIIVGAHLVTTPIPSLFGTAGTILVLLIWLYSIGTIIFYAAAFVRVYDESRGFTLGSPRNRRKIMIR